MGHECLSGRRRVHAAVQTNYVFDHCKTVHDYLNKDQWDMKRLERMLNEEIGEDIVKQTRAKMLAYWKNEPKDIRGYFEQLDARVAELKQAGGSPEMTIMQRQECFILANNFIGDDETPSKVYLYRMIEPFTRVMTAKVMLDMSPTPRDDPAFKLKYLNTFTASSATHTSRTG